MGITHFLAGLLSEISLGHALGFVRKLTLSKQSRDLAPLIFTKIRDPNELGFMSFKTLSPSLLCTGRL